MEILVIIGWIPIVLGIVAAVWLVAHQAELSVFACLALLCVLAAIHAIDPPIPLDATLESLTQDGLFLSALESVSVELLATAVILSLIRHLRERDDAEQMHWDQMDTVRQIAEFFDNHARGGRDGRQAILKLGCDLLDLEVGLVSHIKNGRFEITQLHVEDDETGGVDFAVGFATDVGTTLCQRTLSSDRALGIESIGNWARNALPIQSYLGMPVRVAGEVHGTLCFASRLPHPRRFRAIDKYLIGLMAGWLGRDLERERPIDSGLAAETIATSAHPDGQAMLPRPVDRLTRPSLDPNQTLGRVEKRLHAALGPNHSLAFDLSPEVPEVAVPRSLFVQVVFGIVANGIEALPTGGLLTLESRLLEAVDPDGTVKRYCVITVRTDGRELGGPELIDRMESRPNRRPDQLSFQKLRSLLAQVDGDHSVHCEPGGGVVLTIYLPEAVRANPISAATN